MARTALEHALLSGVNLHAGTKHSDGTFPHNFWVSTNGYDGMGTGSGYGNGSFEAPFLTPKRAIREARDGRGDRVLLMPGSSYTDSLDIGSGGTGYGPNGGYAKRDLQIIGDDSLYNGRIQIVGDGSSAHATIRVLAGYTRGFVLKNVELDVTTVSQPALHIITDDDGTSPTSSDDNYRFAVENIAVRSDNPTHGILLEGATLGTLKKLWIQGPTIGIGLCGSLSNFPDSLDFEDLDFRDCVNADIATLTNNSTTVAGGAVNMTNIAFLRARHWDRGGTPVTNYVNMAGTMVNVHFFDGRAARDVADGTLIQLPADVVWIGHSAGGVESVIGA